jgi:hypothetical protein
MDRSVVLALWIGGGVVVVLILAIVLTSLLGGSGDAPADESVAKAESEEKPTTVPVESKPVSGKNASEPIELKPAADADAPAKAKKNRQKKPSKTRSQSQTPKRASKPVEPEPAVNRSDGNMSRISIELSAGTALAQTLPTGTAMGFSVDYKFANGQPDPSAAYLWVIQPADGQPLAKPVRLQSKGTLQDFAPQLRPENGPFQTHIEDQRGTRLSESLRMR